MPDYKPAIIESETPSLAERIANPYGKKRYRFEISLTSQDLKDKLKRDTSMLAGIPFMQKPFIGRVAEQDFEIRWGRNNTRNSFAPVARGKISGAGSRCEVELDFKLGALSRIAFLFVFVMIMVASFVITRERPAHGNVIFVYFPLLVTVPALIVSYFVGVKMGKNDIKRILGYFKDLPDSKEIEPSKLIE